MKSEAQLQLTDPVAVSCSEVLGFRGQATYIPVQAGRDRLFLHIVALDFAVEIVELQHLVGHSRLKWNQSVDLLLDPLLVPAANRDAGALGYSFFVVGLSAKDTDLGPQNQRNSAC